MLRPEAPPLELLCTVECEVAPLIVLGPAPGGERRLVPLRGGIVHGRALRGRLVEGGSDWQWCHADGSLEINAHYAIETEDGAYIEVQSIGLRHGPPEVMAALARGETVPAGDYYFRTSVRFTTGAPAWQHLNRTLAIGVGTREPRRVLIDLFAVG